MKDRLKNDNENADLGQSGGFKLKMNFSCVSLKKYPGIW